MSTLSSFINSYAEQFSLRPLLDGLFFDSIGEAESIWLERRFEVRKVLEVVKVMNGDKAYGHDSISMVFFQDCSDVLNEDFMKVFCD